MITKELEKFKKNYFEKSIQVVDGLYYNQAETIKKIEYYWNSKYINGQQDELGRTKPFYNITKFRVNVATRATDLDVKDVRVTSDNPNDRVRSMLLNHELKNWMKKTQFSKLLNDFGKNRAKYGGALIKKVEKDGELKIELVEWKNVLTDPTNIEKGAICEIHYMSPSELDKKRDVWEHIDEAIKLAVKSKGGKKEEAKVNKVEVYEIHGEFPETYWNEEGDEKKYKQMMFIIAGDYILYKEEEKELPYRFLAWDYVAGRGLGIGIVEDGFEAQMWTNDAILAEKNIIDLAGKVFIKTNSKTLGNNAISDMPNGMVIELNEGEDANILNLTPSSLPEFQNLVDKWNTQYERATNTFEAVTGETLPANTPLGSVAIQSAQASSFFDYRREEAGIFWSDILTNWVLSSLIKKINKAHILTSDFSIEELEKIDDAFSTYQANQRAIESILSGKIISQEDYNLLYQAQKDFLQTDGKRRYIDIPKNYFKDFETKITIDLTGETRNKQATLQSLDNILAKFSSNPTLLQDPNLMGILNQMLEISGINFIPKPIVSPIQPKAMKGEQQQGQLQNQTEAVLPEAQK